eukprot:g11753.t1
MTHASQGNSCHLCHSSFSKTQLFFCSSVKDTGRLCRKKFCFQCLSRKHPELFNADQQISNTWVCPSCLNRCECSTCRSCKHGAKRKQCHMSGCQHSVVRSVAHSRDISQVPVQTNEQKVEQPKGAACEGCGFFNATPSKFCPECGHKQLGSLEELACEAITMMKHSPSTSPTNSKCQGGFSRPVNSLGGQPSLKRQRVRAPALQAPKPAMEQRNPRTPDLSPSMTSRRAVSIQPGALFSGLDTQQPSYTDSYHARPYGQQDYAHRGYPSDHLRIVRPQPMRLAPGHGIVFKAVPS